MTSTAEIIELSKKYLLNTYNRLPMAPVKGRGCWLWDAEGKKYLDFFSGIAVCNLGHSDPRVLRAIAVQARKLLHTSNVFYLDHQAELAQWLVEHSFADKVFFCNSGAEANEGAVKLARKYARKILGQDRYEVITMNRSFHGRTLGMISATGQEKVQKGFEPLLPGFRYADFGDLSSLEKILSPQTIAIMVEPVQGEGGVRLPSPDYFKGLRDLCHRHKLLLIYDEVQVGIGRTGKMFAYEHSGIAPDIMTLAKALGNGLPIGALLARDFVASAFLPGDHASTFGGNPFVTAVALEVVKAVSGEALPNVGEISPYLERLLRQLPGDYSIVQEVRGVGLLWGIDLACEARPFVERCLKKGLLINAVGPQTIRMAPSLLIRKKEIDFGIKILKEALNEEGSQKPL
ncbi:MAG: aspartate aminotransferase family protein [Deltaproteobacteria bacterium]|nr:aspartate aminotransferase family protein [Deltaproteobacteria bacterium]